MCDAQKKIFNKKTLVYWQEAQVQMFAISNPGTR